MNPRILMLHRQGSAVGAYRIINQARLLEEMGYDVTYSDDPRATYHSFLRPEKHTIERKDWLGQWFKENAGKFDILWVDRGVSGEEVGLLAGFKHYSQGCKMVVDFDDDFTQVPPWNPAFKQFQPGQEAYHAGLNHLKLAEMVTVSTPGLEEAFRGRCHRIHCLPNRIDPKEWDHPVNPERSDDPHVRILYGGAAGHYGDLDDARAGLEAVVRKQVVPLRLICFGTYPAWVHELSHELPGKTVCLPWISFVHYPKAIAWGGFDMALAPLADHPFNKGKSNIKFLEAAVQGIPFICSNIGPYADIPDECAIKVENTPARWAEAITTVAQDDALRDRLRACAREEVLSTWTLDKNMEILHTIIDETLAAPRIETAEDARLASDQLEDRQ
jgi:glycosyltransferase involved in cell wall biosynthesis